MNIAIVFDEELQGGGGYQQQLSTILELQKLEQYNFITFVFSKENQTLFESKGIKSVFIKKTFFDKSIRYILRQDFFYKFCEKLRIKTFFEKKLDYFDIDLVYFLFPSLLATDLVSHNYIVTVWDLCHRDTPEFPEVNFYRMFESREQLYNKCLYKAVAILVDSEYGKRNMIKRYGIDENRISVVPFSPSLNIIQKTEVDIKNKYNIKGNFIFYPAQFWSHKNHIYIIDAISILKNKGINLYAIFSGADKGNLKYVLEYAKNIGVSELIRYIGFAPNDEMYSLYKNSLAMVMPSYFGPTNIPPLEAFFVGTPVCYPDRDGLREQVGDAALLCNLNNPDSLADNLISLLNSEELRNNLIEKGIKRLNELSETSVTDTLKNIFDNYAPMLKCWKV